VRLIGAGAQYGCFERADRHRRMNQQKSRRGCRRPLSPSHGRGRDLALRAGFVLPGGHTIPIAVVKIAPGHCVSAKSGLSDSGGDRGDGDGGSGVDGDDDGGAGDGANIGDDDDDDDASDDDDTSWRSPNIPPWRWSLDPPAGSQHLYRVSGPARATPMQAAMAAARSSFFNMIPLSEISKCECSRRSPTLQAPWRQGPRPPQGPACTCESTWTSPVWVRVVSHVCRFAARVGRSGLRCPRERIRTMCDGHQVFRWLHAFWLTRSPCAIGSVGHAVANRASRRLSRRAPLPQINPKSDPMMMEAAPTAPVKPCRKIGSKPKKVAAVVGTNQ
jgi:hypothetical protein